METISNYNERFPTIYSHKKNIKSISNNTKTNLIKCFDYSLYNNKYKIRNNSCYNENKINNKNILENNENVNNYNKMNNNYKTSQLNEILGKLKLKNNNIHCFNLSKKSINKNNLFSESYYNFIVNLKRKRDEINNEKMKIKQLNENKNNEETMNKSNDKILYQNIEENKKNNLEFISPIKTLNNTTIKSKTPGKIKLSINNTINNNFHFNLSNRNNVFGVFNDNYSVYSNNNSSNKKICPLCQKEIEHIKFKFHFNLHPTKIFDWLYLGSFRNACNIRDLKDLKINYILNCAIECENKNLTAGIYSYHAKINDSPYFQINLYFDKTNSFINKAKLSGGKILIHCQLGISRSTSCLIAYMIKYMGYTALSALQFIKNKRPQVMPNFGFLQQLKNYENKIKIKDNNFKSEIDNEVKIKEIKKEKNFYLLIK